MLLSSSTLRDQQNVRADSMAWIIELLTFLAALAIINVIFFPNDLAFRNIAPHPLWLVVLPVAARYGFIPGMVAGLCAAFIHFASTVLTISDPTWSDITRFPVWKTPFFLLITGIILGEIRETQKQHHRTLLEEHKNLAQKAEAQQQEYTLLRTAKEELDLRIITQQQTLSTLYEAARNLRHLDEDAILPALLELLREHLEVRQAAAYTLTWSGLIMASHIGPIDGMPETIPVDEGLSGAALSQRKTMTIRDILSRTKDGPQFLIVAPILGADQVRNLGTLAIRDLPFTRLTTNGVRMVSLLADWGGTSLDNAQQFSKIKDQLITDETSRTYTFSYFQSRITEEINRCKRYRSIFSILYIEFPIPEDKAQESTFIQSVSFVIMRILRVVDIVFKSGRPERLIAMLPSTDRSGAEQVAKKIQTSLDDLKTMSLSPDIDRRPVRIGISTFGPDCDTPRTIFDAAAKDLAMPVRTSAAPGRATQGKESLSA